MLGRQTDEQITGMSNNYIIFKNIAKMFRKEKVMNSS